MGSFGSHLTVTVRHAVCGQNSQTVLIPLAFQIISRADLTDATECPTNCDLQRWRHTAGRQVTSNPWGYSDFCVQPEGVKSCYCILVRSGGATVRGALSCCETEALSIFGFLIYI